MSREYVDKGLIFDNASIRVNVFYYGRHFGFLKTAQQPKMLLRRKCFIAYTPSVLSSLRLSLWCAWLWYVLDSWRRYFHNSFCFIITDYSFSMPLCFLYSGRAWRASRDLLFRKFRSQSPIGFHGLYFATIDDDASFRYLHISLFFVFSSQCLHQDMIWHGDIMISEYIARVVRHMISLRW